MMRTNHRPSKRDGSDEPAYKRGGEVWKIGFSYLAAAVLIVLGVIGCSTAGLAMMKP